MTEKNKTKSVRKTAKADSGSAAGGTVSRKRVVLSVKAAPGSSVYLSGSFNDWSSTQKKMIDKAGDGVFTTTVTLPPGLYEYKFVINGIWTIDPDPDRDWIQNALGTQNSLLRVGYRNPEPSNA